MHGNEADNHYKFSVSIYTPHMVQNGLFVSTSPTGSIRFASVHQHQRPQ